MVREKYFWVLVYYKESVVVNILRCFFMGLKGEFGRLEVDDVELGFWQPGSVVLG